MIEELRLRSFHESKSRWSCLLAFKPLFADRVSSVLERRFFSRDDVEGIRFKPDSLIRVAWGETPLSYDPMEELVK